MKTTTLFLLCALLPACIANAESTGSDESELGDGKARVSVSITASDCVEQWADACAAAGLPYELGGWSPECGTLPDGFTPACHDCERIQGGEHAGVWCCPLRPAKQLYPGSCE